MAAFIFPANPSDGQVVTNDDTGTKYIYQAQYNKWMVALKEPQEDFVDLAGYETMTGPLAIEPAEAITGNPAEPTLQIQASPFKDLGNSPDSNFVSQIFRATDVNGRSIVTLTNSDADNLPILQGKRSALRIYAAETLVGITGNQYEIPDGGAEAGFAIVGPTATNVSSSAKVLTAFYTNDGSGSSVRYYGRQQNQNDLATTGYVANYVDNNVPDDTFLELVGGNMSGAIKWPTLASGDALNVNSSNFQVTYEGTVLSRGNITVKQSASSTGRLYVKDTENAANFTVYPTGGVEQAGALTFKGTGSNTIRGYGNAAKEIKFQVSNNVAADETKVYTDIFSIAKQSFTVAGGTNAGTSNSNTVSFVKQRGNDSSDDFIIEGATNDAPTVATGTLFQVHRNGINDASNADAINYFGRVVGDNNIQTKSSVLDLIEDNPPETLDDVTIDGTANVTGQVKCNTLTVSNGGTFSGAATANVEYIFNGGTVTFYNQGVKNYSGLWQQNSDTDYLLGNGKKLTFYPDTTKVDYQGNPIDPLLIINGKNKYTEVRRGLKVPKLISVSPEADGNNDDVFFNIGSTGTFALQVNDSDSISSTNTIAYFTKVGFAFYQNVQFFNSKRISGLGTPLSSSDAATKSYVDTTTISVVNTPTGSGNIEASNITNTALTISRPYDSGTAGRGFTLTGSTEDQPTNPSAIMLALQHYPSGQADELLYYGGTSDDDSLQTKASVEGILGSHAPDKNNSTAYGTLSVIQGEQGASSQFRIRNDANTGDTFKVNHDGSVNAYGAFYSFIGEHENATIRNTSTTNNNTTISFDTKKNGGVATQCIITSDDFQIKRDLSVAQSALVYGDITSMAGQVIAATDLISNNPAGGGGIQLYSASTVSGITAWGAANKTFKIFTGETKGTDTKQMLAISQTEYIFGNTNIDVPFTFKSYFAPTQFEFTQSLAMRFNDMVNPLTFQQGYIKNLNGINTTTDATEFLAQCVGGTNQKFKFNGTTSSGDTITVAQFTPNNSYILNELDIYSNGASTGKIYSYGYSRGLEIWAADYKTSKGNSLLTSKFEAGMLSIMTDYITWDNKSARPNSPYHDLYLRLGLYGQDSQYPRINFQWATATGVDTGMTMEYSGYAKVPNVTLNTDAHVTAHAAPTTGDHLCNKTYVDNKTVSLQSAIHSAVNSSTDFASLKAALLAALA